MKASFPHDLMRGNDVLQLLDEDGGSSDVESTVLITTASTEEGRFTSFLPYETPDELEKLALEAEPLLEPVDALGLDQEQESDFFDDLPRFLSPLLIGSLPNKADCDELDIEIMLQSQERHEQEAATFLPSLVASTNNSLPEDDAGGNDGELDDEEAVGEKEILEKEAKYLNAQKDFLETCANSSRMHHRKRTKCTRRERRLAKDQKLVLKQHENRLLNGLVRNQNVFIENVKAMLEIAPVNELRFSLMTPLESYIRLGKDFMERKNTLLSLRREKIETAYKFIERKSQGLDCCQPYEYSDMFDQYGKHYCVHFSIARYDGVNIFQLACGLYRQLAEQDEALNQAWGTTALRESFGTIKCNFMHQRVVSSMKQTGMKKSDRMPDMESNGVFFCQFEDDSAVLTTDYVDQDELYPYDTSNRIRKDVTSAAVLSRHVDADGKMYVVMKRYLMARFHMYPHKVSWKQQGCFFRNMFNCHGKTKALIIDRLPRNDTGCCCSSEGVQDDSQCDVTGCCCTLDN